MNTARRVLRVAVAAVMTLAASGASAQQAEFDWGASLGATHSDNIGRVATNEQSETTLDAGLQMTLSKPEGRMTADLDADLMYQTYLDNSYDDELRGFLNGTLSYQFIPEHFSWVVQDNYGQTLIEARAVDTPGNRQNTNVFTTGPDIQIRLGARTNLRFEGRWIDAAYEESDTDSERLTGQLSLIRNLSPASYLSLNGSATRVEYDKVPPNSNYDSNSVYLGYGIEGPRTSLSLVAGQTEQHDYGDSTSGPLFDLGLTRKLTPRSQLSFRMGTNLVDSLDAFLIDAQLDAAGRDTNDAVVSRDTYQLDYMTLGFDLASGRNSFTASVDWREEDHEIDSSLDRESLGVNVGFSRSLRPSLSGSIDGYWESEEFAGSGIESDDWSVGLGLDWGFARGFTLGLRVERFEGSGDAIGGTGVRDYVENRVSMTLGYRPSR